MGIFAALTDRTLDDAFAELRGRDMRALKEAVTDVVVQRICPIGGEIERLLADEAHLRAVLGDGRDRAQAMAEATMGEVRRELGLAV